MKKYPGFALAILSLGTTLVVATVLARSAVAEVIRVPVGQQAAEKRVLEVPKRGATQAEVERRFGAPLAREPAVGSPPISSWDYENYRVYFERNLVLHTVLKGTATPAPSSN